MGSAEALSPCDMGSENYAKIQGVVNLTMFHTKMLLDQARDEYVQAVYSARQSAGRQQDRAMLIAERKVKDLEYQYYSELRERDIRNLEVYKERSNQMTSQVFI
ncbi:hypothetical protein [Synechococcus sp. NOUM97013]|uniref:hypothetical protein n=1 Tax=Synechococcus sp. NOUM97013 TaxID=1442555 RepID=UPI001645B540|nr:hypothetical protein [Synechococcus sp. NOUM97013]